MNIVIGRYPCPTEEERADHPDAHWPADRWDTVIEPEDRSWIVFVAVDGKPYIWLHRDATGGCIGEAITRG